MILQQVPVENFVRLVGPYHGQLIKITEMKVYHVTNAFLPNGTSYAIVTDGSTTDPNSFRSIDVNAISLANSICELKTIKIIDGDKRAGGSTDFYCLVKDL